MSSPSPAKFQQDCPHCGWAATVRASLIGQEVSCPKCKRTFEVADPAAPPERPAGGGFLRAAAFWSFLVLTLGVLGPVAAWLTWRMLPAREPAGTPVAEARPTTPEPPPPVVPPPVPVATTKAAPPEKLPKGETDPTPTPRPTEPTPPAPGPGGRRLAFLVGVQEYGKSDWNDLRFTENDITQLADVLRGNGYAKNDVVALTSSAARQDGKPLTARRILGELDALLARCGPDDLLLVALTGHGCQINGQDHFCGFEARKSAPESLVRLADVQDRMAGCKAGMKLLLLDACREYVDPNAKGLQPTVRDPDKGFGPARATPGVVSMYSCSPGEQSFEDATLKHGVFFHFLVQGLAGSADGHRDGRITWPELFGYIDGQVDTYAAQNLGGQRRQRPYFKGEGAVNTSLPLSVRPEATQAGGPKPKPPEPWRNPLDIVPDFIQASEEGQAPKGTDALNFVCYRDKTTGRMHAESNRKKGWQLLRLPAPPQPVRGDFILEVEFELHGHDYRSYGPQEPTAPQHLLVRLEGEGGHSIPISINHHGVVNLPDTQLRSTGEFKEGKVNLFRLIRQGDSYSVTLNEARAAAARLPFAGAIESVQLGVVASRSGPKEEPARLYKVKLGRVAGADEKQPPPAGKSLIDVDFERLEAGNVLPEGWKGDGMSLLRDERFARGCLEVSRPEGTAWLTPAKFAEPLAGDFVVEAEFLLNGTEAHHAGPPAHRLDLRLEGDKAVPLTLHADCHGNVRLADGGRSEKAKAFQPHQVNRVRLVRRGDTLQVSCNDIDHVRTEAKNPGTYDRVRVALTAGIPTGYDQFSARLYSLRVVRLPAGPDSRPPFEGFYEDFLTTRLGDTPAGWTSARKALATRSVRDRATQVMPSPWLTLNPETTADVVELPPTKLDGNFKAEFVFWPGGKNSVVSLGFAGKKDGKDGAVEFGVAGEGKVAFTALGASPAGVTADQWNRLELTRLDGVFTVRLNDTPVPFLVAGRPIAEIPANQFPAEFTRAIMTFSRPKATDESPSVRLVQFGALPAKAGPRDP